MKRTFNVYINGYGAPLDVMNDRNYTNYLNLVKLQIKQNPELVVGFTLFLAGGITNNPNLSEAQAMNNWFEACGFPEHMTECILLDQTTTGQANIEAMSVKVVGTENSKTFFFCEYTRRFATKFFVRNIFASQHRETEVVGIAFDIKSLTWTEYFKTIFLRLPLHILAYYFPFFDRRVRKPLRTRHVAHCRRELEK